MTRLAIVTSHPIQYYAPWFRHLAAIPGLSIRVFYLWDFGVEETRDPGFGTVIKWDVPLLGGYEHDFVPNEAARPGTNHFRGLINRTLPERLRAWNPDAVLLMIYHCEAIFRLLASWRKSDAPLIFRGDSHRLRPATGPKELLKGVIIRWVFRHLSAALYVGKANRKYFESYGIPAANLFFSPHAVHNDWLSQDREKYRAEARAWRAELGIPESHRVALFLGKFENRKRTPDLAKAVMKANLREASLILAGTGEELEMVKELCKGQPHIHFVGFVNQSQIPRTLMASDLLVLPSDIETWGLVLNEAMAAGLGVIASDLVGAAYDLIEEGANGMMVHTYDIDALSEAIAHALTDGERLASWGRRSEEIIAGYSYTTATAGLLEALKHVGAEVTP